MKTLKDAYQLQEELTYKIIETMDKLDDLHTWGGYDLDRDKLWLIRSRVQDAIRMMTDRKALRKELKI